MHCIATLWIVVWMMGLSSCRKEDEKLSDQCSTDAPTIRTIVNAAGTVEKLNGKYYIIEQNTIDTRLYPCSLATEFMIDGLVVNFTGTVKRYTGGIGEPCCTELLNISKITR
jgi:hypothetical protein